MPKSIWGKVVLYLKEKKDISLQIACGDIIDVDIKDDDFVVNINNEFLYKIISSNGAKEKIINALRWQGFTGKLIINRILTKKDIQEKDFENLKNLGIKFEIKKE